MICAVMMMLSVLQDDEAEDEEGEEGEGEDDYRGEGEGDEEEEVGSDWQHSTVIESVQFDLYSTSLQQPQCPGAGGKWQCWAGSAVAQAVLQFLTALCAGPGAG